MDEMPYNQASKWEKKQQKNYTQNEEFDAFWCLFPFRPILWFSVYHN